MSIDIRTYSILIMKEFKVRFFWWLADHPVLDFLFVYLIWPLWDFISYIVFAPFTLLKMIPFLGGRFIRGFNKFADTPSSVNRCHY